ncbi:MAG: MBL fold metallo-hydrolase [Kiritimatiellae bacterium]|nr:MBL fold metallo-hydrolase [Kiritimatiellia bacterium]MDD4737105.1 MBL fold metallo-hydrolase [Kiritimatiellia bacterium]
MKAVFLGTGTSHGVPMIGCGCAVCTSSNPKNKRRRASLYLSTESTHVIVDTCPDFREQVLTFQVRRVDAVLLTHSHADHVFGFDDLRCFYAMQGAPIDVFGSRATLDFMNRTFAYVHQDHLPGASVLRANFREVTEPFQVGDTRVTPLPVRHGTWTVYGYLVESGGRRIGYVPDCNEMPDTVIERLKGIEVMVLDGLRHRPHPSHFAVEEAVQVLQKINAGRSYLTHICHEIDHEETGARLPEGIELAYDGLTISP